MRNKLMSVLLEARELLQERTKLSREAALADKLLGNLERELPDIPLKATRSKIHFKAVKLAYEKKDKAFKKRMDDLATFSVGEALGDLVEVIEMLQAINDTKWQAYFDSAQDLLELIVYAETHLED